MLMHIHTTWPFGGTVMIKSPVPTETAVRTVIFNQLKSDENAGVNACAPTEIAIGSLITSGGQNFHFIVCSKRPSSTTVPPKTR